MHQLRNIKWLPVLMGVTILAIAAFQFYWLQKAYQREERTLEMRTNILFRETVRSLQAAKLKFDRTDTARSTGMIIQNDRNERPVGIVRGSDLKVARMMDVMMQKVSDSGKGTLIITK